MKTLELSGIWKLKKNSTGEEYPCRIPGDNFSALLEAGVIDDPYFGENESELQWIGEEDWTISMEFEADRVLTECSNLILELDNADTFFDLKVNGRLAGTGNNMFIGYRFQLAGLILEGTNTIEIIFKSPVRAAANLIKAQAYPVPHALFPVQSMGRNLVRKVQCHSGWDWGPCLMVSGLYSTPILKASGNVIINHVYCEMRPADKKLALWELIIHIELNSTSQGMIILSAECAGVESSIEIKTAPGNQTETIRLEINKPDLWWPTGYGKQPLYRLTVRTENESVEKMIGFRNIEVKTETDEHGTGMVFRVNNLDIFARGANWIPSDALPSRQTAERYEQLIDSAVEANMNMLRVWGGGQYEQEIFYELCDRKGILIWQDFMFACAMYPADRQFLNSVRAEAEYQVKRLMDHPSIALWCGNNENVGALTWFEESKANRDRYIIDYDRLNEGVIGNTVKALDPARKWWPSSPSAGEGDYSDCWHDDSRGDMHYWSVWHEGKPFEAYYDVIPRFCSEFGFQSLPSLKAIEGFCPPGNRNISAPVMEHHQRNDNGNTIILHTLSGYFRMAEGFEETVYLSRIQQAMAIQTAVEYWRTKRPICMGALYWQLNDVWPAASWSSLDYDGSWKPLHYSAKRFFAPLLLTLHETTERDVDITICNEGLHTVRGTVHIALYNFDGAAVDNSQIYIESEPGSAIMCKRISRDKSDSFRREHFYSARFIPEDDNISILENYLLLHKPKRCNIKPADIRAEFQQSNVEPRLLLRTDKPAFHVVLEHENWSGRFSDNNLLLLPERESSVYLLGSEIEQAEAFTDGLAVHSLRNY